MSTPLIPWTDLIDFPRLLRQSWRHHRATGAQLKDLSLHTTWKSGPAAPGPGPFMLSYTQYTPKRITDVPDIWRAADRLGDQLAQISGAVGVMTYLQPARRHVGSLSVWTEERALATFMGLPYHVEIMRRYRPRGLPLRSAKWWSDEFHVGAAMADGRRLLDEHREHRVTIAKR